MGEALRYFITGFKSAFVPITIKKSKDYGDIAVEVSNSIIKKTRIANGKQNKK